MIRNALSRHRNRRHHQSLDRLSHPTQCRPSNLRLRGQVTRTTDAVLAILSAHFRFATSTRMATTVSALEFVRGFQRTMNQIANRQRNRQVSLYHLHPRHQWERDAVRVTHLELGHSAPILMMSTVALQQMNAHGFSPMIHIPMNVCHQPRFQLRYQHLCRRLMTKDVVLERIMILILTHSVPNMKMT